MSPELTLDFDSARGIVRTKAETSPPIPAIWRTNVAVIGATAGDAGRKPTEFQAHGFVHAGICIS